MTEPLRKVEYKTEGNSLILASNDCDRCYYFATSTIAWPGGNCSKHKIGCGIGYTCDDFAERKTHGARLKLAKIETELANVENKPIWYEGEVRRLKQVIEEADR